MRINFHLKLAIGIIVVFGLLLLGFAIWTPVRVKYYAWQYRSTDVAARVKAIDGLIKLGEPGIEKLKAIYPDGPEAVEMLVECWDDVNKLIKDRNKTFALLKLEKGWDVAPDLGYSPLSYQHVAAFNGYLETVKLLMKKSGNNECHGWLGIRKPEEKEKGKAGYKSKWIYGTPIHVAAASGKHRVIDYILSQGIDVNVKNSAGETLLHVAAGEGQAATAEFLISKGADVNAKDRWKRTPLHLAAMCGHTKTAELLISKGADANEMTNGVATPLHVAALFGQIKAAELLISKGADVNTKDNTGNTPLHWAAEASHTKTAEFLISKGADVNAMNENGWTALHYAASEGHTATAEFLISKGADVNATDDDGETALDPAIESKHKETEKLLRAHGAKTGAELEAEKK